MRTDSLLFTAMQGEQTCNPEYQRTRPAWDWLVLHARLALGSAFMLVFNAIQGNGLIPGPLRWALLRAWGAEVKTYRIGGRCWFGGPDIHIGSGTFVNFGCVFDNSSTITIGAGCAISMETMFVTSTHVIGRPECRAGQRLGKPIIVGDGCWIGARTVILPGVTVGAGCIVAAGAVVNQDCEPDGLYAGVPARRVRDL
jgi:maltose O-acetyltransferase